MKTCIRVVVLLMAFTGFFAESASAQNKKLTAAPNIVPPATEAMQNPEFWISHLDGYLCRAANRSYGYPDSGNYGSDYIGFRVVSR